MTRSVRFRTARPEELSLMLGWAAAEGWNPGLADAVPFHAADPEGFFVAECDGAVVACISVVNHSPDFAFLGFYICAPEFRGQGIGKALWDHALAHAGTRCIGLDGVAAQEANYAASGFVRAGASRRFAGTLTPETDAEIRDVGPQDLAALARVDLEATGIVRPAFLFEWLKAGADRVSVALEEDQGFATIRRCGSGVKIGPIIAPDTALALRLARAALARLPSETVFIDVAPGNLALAEALEGLGFEETFATARMYRGDPPRTGPTLQAIATMELG
ncbi:GNAT family N-acetyltransferase [Pseudooceanicola sp. CBS1P-1]|uniref:GNAT family N-acetyltransferase n=1 Tax=Pseudooceanicola albus TaxID=2692189 RepID=A0A6L7G977_9RHOB|nr:MULTISPECIES: GNAT family N-acetyltransferase [Pseudooceanicola]MBT9382884.1 GNAT family N-acetyltransferase [Pseudooceanicola endophyticus]MXN20192.1 GNAT family N-acetyltransferase [Pseudooceanicola albus]